MANNYTQFSAVYEDTISNEESRWLQTLASTLNHLCDKNIEELEIVREIFEEEATPVDMQDVAVRIVKEYALDVFDVDLRHEPHGVWFVSEESSDPYHVAILMHEFFKKFRTGQKKYFGFSWADTCSKMRVNEFGGGCVFVTEEEIITKSSYALLQEMQESYIDSQKL